MALDVIQESLRKLLMIRYVERCPSPEPVISPPVEQDAKKRGAKSKVIVASSQHLLFKVIE